MANKRREVTVHWRPIAVGVEDAAQSLGIGINTMWQLIRDGTIPSKKQGRRTLVLTVDLERHASKLPAR
jgi:excisionase family DNA binding protein